MRCSRSAILPTMSLKLSASRASSSLAAHPDLDMLARREASGGFVEPRERLGDAAARRARSRRPTRSRPSKVMTAKRELQLARVGQRLGLGISEQQDRPLAVRRRSAAAWQARSSARPPTRHLERRRLRRHAPRASDADRRRRAPTCCPTPPTSGRCSSSEHRGVERNCREPLEPAHLASVEIGGEHHPADQGRRHDRRGDELARPPGEHRDAGQAPVVERLPQRRRPRVAGTARSMPMTLPSAVTMKALRTLSRAGGIAERGLHRRLVAALRPRRGSRSRARAAARRSGARARAAATAGRRPRRSTAAGLRPRARRRRR